MYGVCVSHVLAAAGGCRMHAGRVLRVPPSPPRHTRPLCAAGHCIGLGCHRWLHTPAPGMICLVRGVNQQQAFYLHAKAEVS
jgi:hypothetical protein